MFSASLSIFKGCGWLIILLFGASLVSAFEQGSYYLIDLVESVDTQPVSGRVGLPEAALANNSPAPSQPPSPIKRSEFEIDFSQGLQTEGYTGFDDIPLPEAKDDQTEFGSETFNLDLSNQGTAFGQ